MRYTAEAMSECPVAVGDILAQKYRVEQILGVGGMGVVVAARHVELSQLFAMKFLLPKLARNREAAERFRREARAAVKITGENVARVVDIGTMAGGIPFMVMEYLEGHDLATELEQSGPLEIAVAVDYVLQACLAIAEAHTHGLIHRDLKPANLFLTERADHSKLIKVLDFGISKSMTESGEIDFSLTRATALVGSPLYMSPEQLENASDVDQRADVWSLGVILFELLTGCMPFNGESMPQLVCAVLKNQCPPIRRLRPAIPEALEQALCRCMIQERDQRFANVAEFAEALAPFAKDGLRHTRRIQRVLRLPTLPSSPEQLKPSPPNASQHWSLAAAWPPVAELTVTGECADDAWSAAEPSPSPARPPRPQSNRPATINSWTETAHGAAPKRRSKAVAWAMLSTLILSGTAGAVWASLGGLDLLPRPERFKEPVSIGAAAAEPELTGALPRSDEASSEPAPENDTAPPLPLAPSAEPSVSTVAQASAHSAPAQTVPPRPPRQRARNTPATKPVRSVQRPTAHAERSPSSSPPPMPSAVTERPRPEPTAHKPPNPAATGFTDFGGRR